jgi:hypothetical protein
MAACENGEFVAQRIAHEEMSHSRRVNTTSARSRYLPARKSSTGIGHTSSTTSSGGGGGSGAVAVGWAPGSGAGSVGVSVCAGVVPGGSAGTGAGAVTASVVPATAIIASALKPAAAR